jgi:hypothetical protein
MRLNQNCSRCLESLHNLFDYTRYAFLAQRTEGLRRLHLMHDIAAIVELSLGSRQFYVCDACMIPYWRCY